MRTLRRSARAGAACRRAWQSALQRARLDSVVRFVVHDGNIEKADVAGMWKALDAGGLG